MTKNKSSFQEITIPDEAMEKVVGFKAITTQGKPRPSLSTEEHRDLVSKKYHDGTKTKDHVTLFRVQDKKDLPKKEQQEHTVQGPNWTPPSSVGFVLGALSNSERVWLATTPSDDPSGLCDKKGEPAIYARELTVAISHGWLARETKVEECYGTRSKKQPVSVLTPPSSPRPTNHKDLQSVMDVNTTWNGLPLSADKLKQQLTPIAVESSNFFKNSKLHRVDFDEPSLKNIENLVKQKRLSSQDLEEIPKDAKTKLLQDIEVTTLLIEEGIEIDELKQIYFKYIKTTNSILGEFSFNEMYNLINTHKEEFENLLFRLKLTIKEIIELYKTNQKMFFDFADKTSILFYEEYSNNIRIEELQDLYTYNEELYWRVINDSDKLIENKDVYLAINCYQVLYKLYDMDIKDDDEFEDQEHSDYDSDSEESSYYEEDSDSYPDEYNQNPAELNMQLSGNMEDYN